MALQISYPTEYGVDIPQAYCCIETIAQELPRTEGNFLTVRVAIYANAAARISGKKVFDFFYVRSTTEQYNAWINACNAGANPITVIYNYLKTLPLFAGALDV